MTTQAYVHHINPFVWQISGDFGVRWYGLAYLAGLVLGGWVIYRLVQRGWSTLKDSEISDFVTYVAIGMMVGGRLGYALFYSPETLTKWSSSFPFWGVLEVNKGGMASHGGIFGIMVACWLYSKKHSHKKFHLIDLTCYGGALGIFFGRIANFINGELYGRVMEGSYAWGVKFPQEMFRWVSHVENYQEPLKKMGVVMAQVPGVAALFNEWPSLVEQAVAGGSVAKSKLHSIVGKVHDLSQKGDEGILKALQEVLLTRHPSQLYQALMEGLLVFIVLWFVGRKKTKPGVISGVFGLTYAVMRILGEQFRMPDSHIGYQLFGLTRGQWLSVGMLVASIVYLWFALKQKEEASV